MPVWRTSPEPRLSAPPPPPSPDSHSLSAPPLNVPAQHPPTPELSGMYPAGTSSLSDSLPWHTIGRVLWSFVWLLLWSALMTAGGKLVIREFFGDHSTVKNVDSPSVVVLLCGSTIVSVLLAAATDLVGMAAIPLCAYLASVIVPPVGIFAVRPLLHTGPTVLEGLAVGLTRWAASPDLQSPFATTQLFVARRAR
ncbi:hypothetical protein K466DRAFT_597843 [Polyporus arcularius HHB13444]|uniref:Uncharacterized protein n=1 Tax=Polyporus arcularius HHB13444 TaxID=1314778 RepID=A0A5C3PJC3_9APHY|nr:hypothetical protein K466DRAFT_597843 [Polyporus arcularius HHB13444]